MKANKGRNRHRAPFIRFGIADKDWMIRRRGLGGMTMAKLIN